MTHALEIPVEDPDEDGGWGALGHRRETDEVREEAGDLLLFAEVLGTIGDDALDDVFRGESTEGDLQVLQLDSRAFQPLPQPSSFCFRPPREQTEAQGQPAQECDNDQRHAQKRFKTPNRQTAFANETAPTNSSVCSRVMRDLKS